MGPGWAVLFYGRWSLGEGLSLGKARDAMFILTGAGTWAGKLAYLATNPLTIQEGWWTIAQAITECQIEVRGPGQPHSHPLIPQPFRFHCPGDSPQKEHPRDARFDHRPLTPQATDEARTVIDIEGIRGQYHLTHPHLPQITDLKAIGVQCQQPSSVSLQSDWSKGSWHSWCGRQM